MKRAALFVAIGLTGLTARGETLAAFDGRCIPVGCVAPRSNTPGILGRRALPPGRLARLGATPDFHHGRLTAERAEVAEKVLFARSANSAVALQTPKPASADLPPISYVCPMVGDEDVIEDKAGRCRKCGMELKPIRLDSVWTCPVHAAVIKDKPGACPIDGRDLVQVTMAVSWTCANTNVDSVNPGTCADGSPMVKKF